MSLVIEGQKYTGKTTTINYLKEYFPEIIFTKPNLEKMLGKENFEQLLETKDVKLIMLCYLMGMFLTLNEIEDTSKYIILDRFYYSCLVYQGWEYEYYYKKDWTRKIVPRFYFLPIPKLVILMKLNEDVRKKRIPNQEGKPEVYNENNIDKNKRIDYLYQKVINSTYGMSEKVELFNKSKERMVEEVKSNIAIV